MHEIFGPYQLIERIASGGMAEIFKARTYGHSGFEKTLVIKRLHPRYTQTPEFVEMLKEEAKIAVGLSHSNIVQIFDLGRVQEHYYIAMEYINGRDLRQLMNLLKEQRAFIPPEAALYMIAELCSGLDFAHRKRDAHGRLLRLVHRDVSPHNLMISSEGEVKIVDFGIAKSLATPLVTEAGVVKGKFCFMSPEQAQGAPLDHRTDVFSAGILLYELLTGRPMYESADDHELLQMVRNARYMPIEEVRPDLPRALHKVIRRALAADREQRYPSARHFQHGIEKVMQRSGLMFSRFQLSQLITSYFPQIKGSHEQTLDQLTDDFGYEEHSLISDYEVPSLNHQARDTGWEVPELIDELEDLSELSELEEEEATDPSIMIQPKAVPHDHASRRHPSQSLGRLATPIPIGSSSVEPAGIGFAPAAPPAVEVNAHHLYDPKYDAPVAYGSSAPLSRASSPHDQITQPPRGAPIDQSALYSSESPHHGLDARQAHSFAPARSGFDAPVESTMILDQPETSPASPPPSRARGNERSTVGRSPARTSRRSDHQKQSAGAILTKLRGYFESLLAHPQGKYALIAVGFIALFVVGRMIKSLMTTPPPAARVELASGTTITPVGSDRSLVKRPKALTNASTNQLEDRSAGQSTGQGARRALTASNQESPPLNRALSSSQVASGTREVDPPVDRLIPVQMISDPDGADVSIDDEWQENVTTPFVTRLKSGKTHFLVFSKIGYEEKRVQIIPQDNNRVVKVSLSPQRGRLVITSEPEGALIRVDGKLIGETPFERDDYPLEPSEFQIKVSKAGYESELYNVRWSNADRGTIELNARLNPEPQAVARASRRSKQKRRRATRRKRRPRSTSTRQRQSSRSSQRSQASSGTGYVSVKGSTWGDLFVDGRFVKKGKIILKHRVSAGRHRLKFCFQGNPNNCQNKFVNVPPNSNIKVFF